MHPADPTLTLHPPHTPCRHRIHTTHLAHRADPTSSPHTPHTPQTLLSPRTRPALTPRAPHTPRPPRPLAAEPQPLPEEPESAPPGGAGGKRRLRCASPTRDSAGGAQAAEAAAANSSRPCAGPGDQRRPPAPCRLRRALPATPRPPPGAMPLASPASRRRLSLHSPLAAIFPSAALNRKLTAQPRPPTPTPPRPPPAI